MRTRERERETTCVPARLGSASQVLEHLRRENDYFERTTEHLKGLQTTMEREFLSRCVRADPFPPDMSPLPVSLDQGHVRVASMSRPCRVPVTAG